MTLNTLSVLCALVASYKWSVVLNQRQERKRNSIVRISRAESKSKNLLVLPRTIPPRQRRQRLLPELLAEIPAGTENPSSAELCSQPAAREAACV